MSRLPSLYEEDENESRRSFGSRFEEEQIYNLRHPAYKLFADALAEEIEEVARREFQRRAAADVALLPFPLEPAQMSELGTVYPEFNIVNVPLQNPVHTVWAANQYMANEYITYLSSSYGTSRVHLGGSQLSSLLRADRNTHIHYSVANPYSLHQHYSRMVDTMRVFRDYSNMLAEHRVCVPRQEYEDHVVNGTYKCCSRGHTCSVSADVSLVDLSVFFMSPDQFAAVMMQHDAKIGMGFFIYHPTMLVKQSGLIPGTDVYYSKYRDKYEILYPDGASGTTFMYLNDWALWLTSHMFRLPSTQLWYHLELLQNRGPFMFFRMTKVPPPTQKLRFMHALELPNSNDGILVQSWKLKDRFTSNPNEPSSWERYNFMVSHRTERRVREFAMQCKPENFSRASVKKQIRVVNDRWVLSGTTVTVMPPLSPWEIEDLTTAIYAKVFVDRYESSKLSSDLMKKLSKIKAFSDLSTLRKVYTITVATVKMVGTCAVGGLIDGFMRSIVKVCDALLFTKKAREISLDRAPMYLPIHSQVDVYLKWLSSRGEIRSVLKGEHTLSAINYYLPGSLLLSKMIHTTKRNAMIENKGLTSVATVLTDITDTSEHTLSSAAVKFSDVVAKYNELDHAPSRFSLRTTENAHTGEIIVQNFNTVRVDDCVETLNQLYLQCLPKVALLNLEFDTYSLSLDPQDRTLAAVYMRCPTYFGDAPKPRSLFRSKLRALNVPKRQNTGQELLTAIATRNLSAPALIAPQTQDFPEYVWECFLREWCVPEAWSMLLDYQSDPVALCEESLRNWVGKGKPEVVDRITKELDELAKPLASMSVGDYLAMIKADVKPTLSNKPVDNVVAPQVIVYHDKLMSALFSSIFRVLVQRFLSILKPEILVNLRKDTKSMAEHIQVWNPYYDGVKYLENDFSQFDKSQGEMIFKIEEYVFRKLGMNEEFLQQWEIGHHYSNIRCVSTGLSLHTMYQRKSGDATTAFGNVIINVLSVCYAYRGSNVQWALFMGDDSLVCVIPPVVGDDTAVRKLAEQFNLIAKYYITDAPYFASHFVAISDEGMTAKLIPDPIKRIERLSMHISGDEPLWRERWESCVDTLSAYKDPDTAEQLSILVPQRYEVSEGFVRGAAGALGTICADFNKFRELWLSTPETLQA